MDPMILSIIVGIVALVAGIVAGKFIFAKDNQKRIDEAELQAQNIIKEAELRAETTRKEKELSAKERFVQLKSEHDKEVNRRNRELGIDTTRATEVFTVTAWGAVPTYEQLARDLPNLMPAASHAARLQDRLARWRRT